MRERIDPPSSVAEARAARRSTWGRLRRHRAFRRAWMLAILAAFAYGLWIGYRTLRLPDAPDARLLVPNAPYAVIELRDASTVLTRQSKRIAALAEPFKPMWRKLIDEWSGALNVAEVATRDVAYMLGDDAALALYPSETGHELLIVAKTHLAARAQIAWNFARPDWRREWGATTSRIGGVNVTRIEGAERTLYVAFDGRLGFAATDRDLLSDAYALRDDRRPFLTRTATPRAELRAARVADQSPNRFASLCVDWWASLGDPSRPFQGVLVEALMDGSRWTARCWAEQAQRVAPDENARLFRSRAKGLGGDYPLVFWHTAVSDRWLANFGASVGVSRATDPDRWASRPLGLAIPKPRANVAILPEIVAFAAVENAMQLRDDLRDGTIRLTWRGTPLRATPGDVVDNINVPLGMGFQYPLGFAATPDALMLGATPAATKDAYGRWNAAAVDSLAPSREPTPADLFRLDARPSELVGVMQRVGSVLSMIGEDSASDAVKQGVNALTPLFRALSRVEVGGMTTPDGFAADVAIEWKDSASE